MAEASRALKPVNLSSTFSDWLGHGTGMAEPEFSVRTAVTAEAVEELRPIWHHFDHSLDTDIDYYLFNLRNDPTILHPYVVTVGSYGATHSMLVGIVRKRKASAVVAFVNVPGPQARELEVEKRGILGRRSSAIDQLLALQLSEALKSGQADFLCFRGLPLRSGLIQELEQSMGLRAKKRGLHGLVDSTWFLTAPEGGRLSFLPGKRRREIGRNTRNLNRTFKNRVSFKCLFSSAQLDTGIRDAMAIAATTYKYSLGWGLRDTSQIREQLKFLCGRGWLRIYLLYVADLPCAFIIGQLYNERFYCQYAGYRPEYRRFSLGWLLTAWAAEHLVAGGARRIDFGQGNQDHSRRLGCKVCQEGTAHVYAATLRGFRLDVFFAVTHAAQTSSHRCNRTLSRLGLIRITRIWREFLAALSSRRQEDATSKSGGATDRDRGMLLSSDLRKMSAEAERSCPTSHGPQDVRSTN
jgi:hypothetical protein